jgi:hypothetical protein
MENLKDAVTDLGSTGDVEERPSKRRCTSVQPHREVGLMRSLHGDKLPGFIGSASGIFFIQSVYGALREPGSPAPKVVETPASDVVPGEDDQLPSVLPQASERPWRADEIIETRDSILSYSDLVELSGSYFANWHPIYPYLHAPTILEYFQKISRRALPGFDSPPELQMVILRSIMSISLADQRQARYPNKLQYPANIVFPSYDAAVDALQQVLTKPTSLLGLQAAISVQLFLISMLQLNAASRLGGLINRMALQLGLHRCPARYHSFSTDERLLRQRVFWSLYAIDRFVCQSMGLPLGINDDDVDVCFPTKEEHVDNRRELPQGKFVRPINFQLLTKRTTDDRLKMLSFVARESRLRGEIIELRNKSLHYSGHLPDRATTITAKLAQWWNEIEDWNDGTNGQQIPEYQFTILSLLKHESNISLHRPILAASRQGAEYDAALQLCVGSARAIITLLHDAMNPRNGSSDSHGSMTLLWPSCTWAIWVSIEAASQKLEGDTNL